MKPPEKGLAKNESIGFEFMNVGGSDELASKVEGAKKFFANTGPVAFFRYYFVNDLCPDRLWWSFAYSRPAKSLLASSSNWK